MRNRIAVKARTRSPWIVYAITVLLAAGTITLSVLNGSLAEDSFLISIFLTMVVGYSTVGALIASRNRIGWVMMAAGLSLIIAGFGDEYLRYGLETNPGSLPGARLAALLSNLAWGPLLVVLILVVLLFPTGRVPGPRWRFLPPAILALFTLGLFGTVLAPGTIDAAVHVENPIGVEALGGVTDFAQAVGFIGLLPPLALSIGALVLRYRRSKGDERQQIRWLLYVVAVVALLILVGIVGDLLAEGDPFGDVLFITIVALVGIGVPSAIGVAILKYRLYDLDLVIKKTVLSVTVAALLTALFVAVGFAVGAIGGRTQTGAVVAAAAIGLAFWPAVRLARRVADRVVYGRRATPYEVLADFSARLAGSYGADDVLPRMATILAGGVGASRAVVWLRVGNELRPAAVAPDAERLPDPVRLHADALPDLSADAAFEVRDRDELLGALAVSMPTNDPMNPSKDRLARDLASQAGLVLRNVRLIEELRASRQRLVAAQDEERRRLERNLHDGAQQQLVALAVKQRLAENFIRGDPDRAAQMLAELQTETVEALENLRDLARGIYPPLLADQGLTAALEAQARKTPVAVTIETDGIGRYAQEIEAATYFCCLEALQNVAKYAEASKATVRIIDEEGWLSFVVADDGAGFDPAETPLGTGLQGMADRVQALGGTLEVRSRPGEGTTLTGRIPTRSSVLNWSAG
ncbi:MAG: sensor histidine kinase [Actinomycetota bacterium]